MRETQQISNNVTSRTNSADVATKLNQSDHALRSCASSFIKFWHFRSGISGILYWQLIQLLTREGASLLTSGVLIEPAILHKNDAFSEESFDHDNRYTTGPFWPVHFAFRFQTHREVRQNQTSSCSFHCKSIPRRGARPDLRGEVNEYVCTPNRTPKTAELFGLTRKLPH